MIKLQTQTLKRGKYQKLSLEIRQQILQLKEQRVKLEEISQITGVKIGTIRSIKKEQRSKIYDKFQSALIEDTLSKLHNTQLLENKTEKQQRSIIKKMIISEFNYETSNYKKYLEFKKNSKRARKISETVQEIQQRLQNFNNNATRETENFEDFFQDCLMSRENLNISCDFQEDSFNNQILGMYQ